MFAAFDIPLSWGDLLKRTAKETLSGTFSSGPVRPRHRELLPADELH
jgi:hypothetical protein